MNLSGRYFIYNNVGSKQFGLRILNLDTDRLTTLAAPLSYSSTYNRGKKRFNITGSTYEEPLEFDIEFIAERPLSLPASQKVKSWLFNKKQPARLYSEMKKDVTRTLANGVWKRDYLNCVFYNPTEIRFADGVHGYKATCLIDSVMALQEEVEYTWTRADLVNQPTTIVINVETDVDDYVFPYMEILMSEGNASDVVITNETDSDRVFELKSVDGQQTVSVDNALGTVYSDAEVSLYDNLTDKRFLRLLPGKNTLTVEGNIDTLMIRLENARYVV